MTNKLKLGLVSISSLILLAACGNGGNDGATVDSGESQTDNVSSVETGTETEDTAEAVDVTLWHAMNGPHQEAITKLVQDFNESQDKYVVEEQNQGDYSTLQQSIMASGVSGDLPTMSQVTASNTPDFMDAGLLTPLDDLLLGEDGFTQEELDDIYPGFMEGVIYNDEIYAMPFSKSTRVMYVNDDLLAEYGFEVPTTWDEIVELGEAMNAADDDAVAMGFENDFAMELETMARQNGAEWISNDLQTVDIGEAASVEAMQFIKDMLENGIARTAGEDGFFSGPFGRGESALYIGSSAGLAHVIPVAEENDITWSTAELPVFNDGDPLTLFAGNDMAVFDQATDEEKAGAIAFMSFLLEPENTAYWAQTTGYNPIRRSALELDSFQTYLEENPIQVAAVNELEYGVTSAGFVGSGEYRNALLETLDAVVVGNTDVAEAMSSLQTETESILENNN